MASASHEVFAESTSEAYQHYIKLATSLFPDNTKWIKLRLKMKNQEGEKLEEEGNRLVTLEWSWILMRMDSKYDLGL